MPFGRENPNGALEFYPGSPAIALSLMRSQDTLIANELHPEDRVLLETTIGNDRRAKLMALDAWVALKSLLPPKERRGVVLIDPPFEEKNEFERMAAGSRKVCTGSRPESTSPGTRSRRRSRSPLSMHRSSREVSRGPCASN